MFGYVTVNKPELKIKEFGKYRSYYCGLCKTLGQNNGVLSRATLSYDMTFLVILLTSLYEPRNEIKHEYCGLHPTKKQVIIQNSIMEYAADINVILSYYHLLDDFHDEKKVRGLIGASVLRNRVRRIEDKYSEKAKFIRRKLKELSVLEKDNCQDIDRISRPFGEILGCIFSYRDDAFKEILEKMGFYLGKYIYLLDALIDLKKDQKTGAYNVLKYKDFDEKLIKNDLEYTARLAIIEFEKLPLERDLNLLRNILYEGMKVQLWKYDSKEKGRKHVL
ncbi:MAG: DUF5685 family protein [Eubacterium sp.]|nr:DUF5685 family protein [Eubacterium sp.]